MNVFGLRAALFLIGTIVFASSSGAITYTATLLTAGVFPNAFGYGASDFSQAGVGYFSHSTMHAYLWNGTTGSAVDLNPAGFMYSYASDVSGTTQIGTAWGSATGGDRAFLWNGTADSAINLHPTGFAASYGTGISGTNQVGYGRNSVTGNYHALMWSGTAASVVDLHPAAFDSSQAAGVSGAFQVGYGQGRITGGSRHALLWSGTADSAVDLHPLGFSQSMAYAVSGTSQAGYGNPNGVYPHALLWHSTPESVVDLHPTGFTSSIAYGVAGSMQVGSATGPNAPGKGHAMLWTGTAASAVDLHVFLSGLSPTFAQSVAYDITDNGSIAGFASGNNGRTYAVFWTPVPEPASWALVACGFLFTLLAHWRRR